MNEQRVKGNAEVGIEVYEREERTGSKVEKSKGVRVFGVSAVLAIVIPLIVKQLFGI